MATASPASQDLSALDADPRLFLYTSLTAGSSHIITATSRLETILKANRIPFTAIDTATDEKARRLWGRRAGNKKLPGLVKEGFVLGDLEQIEEWNEYGELKENIGPVPPAAAPSPAPKLPANPTALGGGMGMSKILPRPGMDDSKMRPLPGATEIKARNTPAPAPAPVEEKKSVVDENAKPETMDSAPQEKEQSINAAKALLGDQGNSKYDHLSAPASAVQSGSATPAVAKEEGEKSAEPAEETGKAVESKSDVDSGASKANKTAPAAEKEADDDDNDDDDDDDDDEEDEDDEDEASAAEGVEGLQLGDGKTISQQAAKEPEDAGKSVED